MALTATWVGRNNVVQADVPVDHFAAGVTPPAGLKTVCNWYWRADPGDAWSAPTSHVVDLPLTSDTFNPPGDGWVRFESYTILDGLASWEVYFWEAEYAGGEVVNPIPLGTESTGLVVITEDGRAIYTE